MQVPQVELEKPGQAPETRASCSPLPRAASPPDQRIATLRDKAADNAAGSSSVCRHVECRTGRVAEPSDLKTLHEGVVLIRKTFDKAFVWLFVRVFVGSLGGKPSGARICGR